MTFPLFNAGMNILGQTPKSEYESIFQRNIDEQFYNSSNWFTIEEETSLASGLYQNVDVRITGVFNPTTGNNIEEDWKRLSFKNINHSVDVGRYYKFAGNYWVTVNVDKIKTLAQTVILRRCNNILRWIDEGTGALYEIPCSLDYLITENRDYATAGSALVTPSGMLNCITQLNDKSNRIKPNQRFLFGNQNNWTSYRVEGGGINNFNNLQTDDNSSAGLLRLSLAVDYLNEQTDDLMNGIANAYTNIYVLSLNETSISGEASQQVQLEATLTLNGESITRSLSWSTSDSDVATVDSAGLVTFVSTGTCLITCQLQNNASVFDSCNVETVGAPVDTYQVVFSPNVNYVLEGNEQLWNVYLYKNTVQEADVFSFNINPNGVPSSNYAYTVIDGNSFKIKNIERFFTDVLEVEAVSGIHSKTLNISLRGAW